MVAVDVDEFGTERALCQGWCLVAETIRRGAETGFLGPIGTLLRMVPWISRVDAIVIVVVQMSACKVTRYEYDAPPW